MSLHRFLNDLSETGRVHVSSPSDQDLHFDQETGEQLRVMDSAARAHLAFEAPAFAAPAAEWGAALLFRICQSLAFRELEPSQIRTALRLPFPGVANPSTVYSVDIVLRRLPDVATLARAVAQDDPLNDEIDRLAHAWPLSSVGMTGVSSVKLDAFIEWPSLRQLYVDRVIRRRDVSRLNDRRVRESVAEALGDHPERCPELAEALRVHADDASVTPEDAS